MDFQALPNLAVRSVGFVLLSLQKVPGSTIVERYIRSSHQNDPIRSAIEFVLFLLFIPYLTASSYSTKTNFLDLTEDAIDELVAEWTPDPLVDPLTELEVAMNEKQLVIVGGTGPRCKLTNGCTVMNFASYNFYNFAGNEHIKQNAIETLRKYGVGPCSAPQFYGTQDVHMETEAKIASFIGTEACILYAHALSTITSVIPSFAKRGDIIVADKAVNYAIRKGLQICRSKIRWYEHNDMEDLERVLQKVTKESKTLTRRLVVTEGLFETIGDTIDLPKIVELKLRYKFRLILDETWSFGVLGRTGRGVADSQSIDLTQVDMIIGSLSGPLSAAGGFCAGTHDVVQHQRVASTAYTYSSAMPAILTTTARETITVMRAQIAKCDWVYSTSVPENPMQLLVLKPDIIKGHDLSIAKQEQILQECVGEVLANNVLITRLKSMPQIQNTTVREQGWQLQPALKVCITTGLAKKDIEKAGVVIRQAIAKVLKKRMSSKLALPNGT